MNTYVCRFCRQPSDPSAPTCPLCGAPVDIRDSVSDSGWTKQPPIRDMAKLQFGQSHVQIAGTTVPIAEFNLAQQEMVYFSHHVLLWADPATRMQNMSMRGGWKRLMAGMPLIMMEAHGPGHIALSDNHAGEVIALPLQHGQSIWVKEHRFLTATGNIRYDWTSNDVWYVTGDNDDQETHYPMGQFGDVFTATERPGLLLLHAPGNVFIRDLQAGPVDADPAELAGVPGHERPGPPAPGVPAEPGLLLLAVELRLPQHLRPDHRARAGSRSSRSSSGRRRWK